jgi:hypothetical protein
VVRYRTYGSEIDKAIGDIMTNDKGMFYLSPRNMTPGMYTFKVKAGAVLVTVGRIFVRV